MIIPFRELSEDALHGVIEEYVTRDGTELTDSEVKIAQVRAQIERGVLLITYDPDTRSCNIVPADALQGD